MKNIAKKTGEIVSFGELPVHALRKRLTLRKYHVHYTCGNVGHNRSSLKILKKVHDATSLSFTSNCTYIYI